jgi:hypothetical protein
MDIKPYIPRPDKTYFKNFLWFKFRLKMVDYYGDYIIQYPKIYRLVYQLKNLKIFLYYTLRLKIIDNRSIFVDKLVRTLNETNVRKVRQGEGTHPLQRGQVGLSYV